MKSKLYSLQVLRGIAAMMVVLFHLSITTDTFFHNKSFNVSWGWLGVDIFFVLSGFIITYVHFQDIKKKVTLRTS